jgi:hypothetical protein
MIPTVSSESDEKLPLDAVVVGAVAEASSARANLSDAAYIAAPFC